MFQSPKRNYKLNRQLCNLGKMLESIALLISFLAKT